MRLSKKIVVLLVLSIVFGAISFSYASDENAELIKTLKHKDSKTRQQAASQLMKNGWKPANQSEEIDFYISLLSQKKALTSILNWYRANYNGFTNGFSITSVLL